MLRLDLFLQLCLVFSKGIDHSKHTLDNSLIDFYK